jgi:hypothetical protein
MDEIYDLLKNRLKDKGKVVTIVTPNGKPLIVEKYEEEFHCKSKNWHYIKMAC